MSSIISRRIACTMIAAFFVATSGIQNAEAQGNTSTGYKIGVVNLQRVLAEYNKRVAKYEELQGEVDRLQKDIDAMSERIEKAKKDYEAGRTTMDDDQRLQTKNKIESDYAEYRIMLESRQSQIDNQEERVLKEVFADVEAAIAKIAGQENYHLILNARSGPTGSVLYSDPTVDVTSKVIELLNKG